MEGSLVDRLADHSRFFQKIRFYVGSRYVSRLVECYPDKLALAEVYILRIKVYCIVYDRLPIMYNIEKQVTLRLCISENTVNPETKKLRDV